MEVRANLLDHNLTIIVDILAQLLKLSNLLLHLPSRRIHALDFFGEARHLIVMHFGQLHCV